MPNLSREHMCRDKKRFETKELAEEVQKKMISKIHAREINVYFCDHCHYWHIGKGKRIHAKKAGSH